MNNPKFNTVMPQSDDRVLCMEVDKPITQEGYNENFLPRVEKMVQEHGEIRVLTYYKAHKGWEEGAATQDMIATLEYGKKLKKLALVNPPEKNVLQYQIKKNLMSGEIRVFEEEELEEAIEWVKS